mmetsp:Transcript_21390/g.24858  ORF Transcript_21390/g.24858 Transcript_21390/m.24858 type:complete len:158 (-) Transcript_21390:215-688(-)
MALPKKVDALPEVHNPKVFHDPNRIRFADLYRYVSQDQIKLNTTFLNYKKSIGYVGGCILGAFLLKGVLDASAEKFVFGTNGNGGEMLKMTTINTTTDYYYNRQFQRFRYLTTEPSGDHQGTETSLTLLADLGYKQNSATLNHHGTFEKRAPHFKYL